MKKSLTLFVILLAFTKAFAQPANDDCVGLIDLGIAPVCPVLDTFTNLNATQSVVFNSPSDNIPSCYLTGVIDRDVWFMFTVPPDGSIVDFTITVTGVDGPNGTIHQPQFAIYRGDCELEGLQELNCATSGLGEDVVSLDLLGLTPGLPYFIRVNDWSASGSPNWGDFVFCIAEYVPVFNIGDVPFTAACAGTLYDTGGPNGDYSSGENNSFTVCPQDFTQCIFVDVQTFATEAGFDFLNIFIGDDTNAPMLTSLNDFGSNVQLQIYGQCVTFQFTSDGSFNDEGFELTWQCSPDTCTVPPPSTCDNPTVIGSLPYTATDLTTCNAANAVNSSPCNDSDWLQGEDVIFTYTSPGDECIGINLTGTNTATAVGIFDACPNIAGDCIAVAGGGNGQSNPSINGAFLELPGTYYIVVDNPNSCTPFNIEVTQVTCPIVLPSAADCDNSIGLNGCGDLPAIVSVAPGQGDPNVIQEGINDGCWGFFTPNFTWFFFQAQEDGNFAFTMQATNPAEASDIDFQVWGPVTNVSDLCTFAYENQPIRSSYAAGADPTGLADIHPVLNTPVTDVCETAIGDDFVSTIPVLTGEYYVVLINDWGGQITSGAVSIDFGNTTTGVLDNDGNNFMVSQDTALCPGESAQLLASGGELYQWFPADGLSCVYCPNPVATISQTTVYHVAINSLCNSDTLEVEVGILQVDAGPDLTVCLNEEIQIVAGSNFNNITYAWTAPTGFLSCTDCPNPIVTATQAGTFNLQVTVTGPTCSFSDGMTLVVLPTAAPGYQINDDQNICFGETVNLGGPASQGTNYEWTSVPSGLVSNSANPSVTPTETTTYYLTVTNGSCPLPSFDSLTVIVSALPIVNAANDTLICQGQSLLLGNTLAEPGVTYSWSPSSGLDNPNIPNPLATPQQTTSYSLTASRQGCEVQETVNVEVTPIAIEILLADTIPICKGVSVPLSATVVPIGTTVIWTPNNGSLDINTGLNVVATPQTATSYIASVATAGCVRFDTIYIGVDSLPWATDILPVDTTICQGEQVLLTSPIYEPGDFSLIEFLWTGDGQLTPDSFYNMVVQPTDTTTYYRTATNGFCSRTDSVVVNVIPVANIQVVPPFDTICPGEQVQLSINGPANLTDFNWTPPTDLSCADCPNPTASPGQTTTYMVEAKFEGCPLGASTTLFVPSGPVFELRDTFICSGEPVLLNKMGNPQATYVWTSSDGSLNTTSPTPTVNPTVATTYTVTATVGDCVSTDMVTVTIATDFTLTAPTPAIICPGTSVTLTATVSPAGLNYKYKWTDALGAPAGESSSIDVSPPSTTTYTVEVSDANNCFTHSITVPVEVSLPFTVTAAPDTVVQAGSPVTLLGTATLPGISFSWADQSGSPIGDGASVTVNTCTTTTYTLTGTDAVGCPATDDVKVTVDQGYSILKVTATEAVPNDTTIYEGEGFVISVTTTPPVLPGATYSWYIGDSLVSTTNDTVSALLNAAEIFGPDLLDSVKQAIRVEITSAAGCSADTIGQLVVKNIPIDFPNAFSPNGDGDNDSFRVVSLIPLTINEFQIWNRWGQKVYDNQNGPKGWDGKQGDKDAPSDVYIYRAVYQVTGGSGKKYTKKGDVTLLR